MMLDVQTPIFFNPPASTDFNKLRMSTSSWLDGDISSFLNVTEDPIEFQSVPTQSPSHIAPLSPPPIAEVYYNTSSPETYSCGSESPYTSDVSQTPSPFDASMFQDSPQTEFTGSIDIDPTLFEQGNLTNPLLLPEIEKILASNPYQASIPTENAHVPHEGSSKKRQREPENKGSDVMLSRDQLLTMTSKEIEEYVSSLKTKRTLTASEEKDLKKQRRLVKNREYASQSRSRKKQYVDELEKQLEQARAETDSFKKQNHILMEENKILKKQLGSIADAIKKSQNGGPALSSSSGSVGVFGKFATIGGGRPSTSPSRTVSACLLAIFFMVFTFAAFWDNPPPLGLTIGSYQYKGGRALLGNLTQEIPQIPEIPEIPSAEETAATFFSRDYVSAIKAFSHNQCPLPSDNCYSLSELFSLSRENSCATALLHPSTTPNSTCNGTPTPTKFSASIRGSAS